MGHKVEAKCVKSHVRTHRSNGRRYGSGEFVYEVDGKTYKRTISSKYGSTFFYTRGDTCFLYWINNLKWAFTKGEAGGVIENIEMIFVMLLPIILAMLTLWLTDGFQ